MAGGVAVKHSRIRIKRNAATDDLVDIPSHPHCSNCLARIFMAADRPREIFTIDPNPERYVWTDTGVEAFTPKPCKPNPNWKKPDANSYRKAARRSW